VGHAVYQQDIGAFGVEARFANVDEFGCEMRVPLIDRIDEGRGPTPLAANQQTDPLIHHGNVQYIALGYCDKNSSPIRRVILCACAGNQRGKC
jgi:hypothetical protein